MMFSYAIDGVRQFSRANSASSAVAVELGVVLCHKHSSRKYHSDTTVLAADGDAAVRDLSRAFVCHVDGGESSRLTSVPVHFTFRAVVIQMCANIRPC